MYSQVFVKLKLHISVSWWKYSYAKMSQVSRIVRLFRVMSDGSTATAERIKVLDTIRCIKSCLRTTVTSERLNLVTVLHVNKERVDNLDIADMVRESVFRCKDTFGHSAGHRRFTPLYGMKPRWWWHWTLLFWWQWQWLTILGNIGLGWIGFRPGLYHVCSCLTCSAYKRLLLIHIESPRHVVWL